MSVAAALVRDAIAQSAAVTALTGTRIYASIRPNAATETCIVLNFGTEEDVSPTLQRTDCLRKLQVEIECMSPTVGGAHSLAEVVRKALHGAKGYYRSCRIIEIRIGSTTTNFDLGADADDQGVHICTVNATAYYTADSVSPTTITDPNANP